MRLNPVPPLNVAPTNDAPVKLAPVIVAKGLPSLPSPVVSEPVVATQRVSAGRAAPNAAAAIADFVRGLADTHRAEIEAHWPQVLRRVAGYNLDIFHPQNERPYTQDGSVNLAHLLVGSEGTLAVTRRLQLQLARLPKHKVLGVVNYTSFHAAMDSAQHIVKLDPSAVELVDRTMIELARASGSSSSVRCTMAVLPPRST